MELEKQNIHFALIGEMEAIRILINKNLKDVNNAEPDNKNLGLIREERNILTGTINVILRVFSLSFLPQEEPDYFLLEFRNLARSIRIPKIKEDAEKVYSVMKIGENKKMNMFFAILRMIKVLQSSFGKLENDSTPKVIIIEKSIDSLVRAVENSDLKIDNLPGFCDELESLLQDINNKDILARVKELLSIVYVARVK